MAQTFYPARIMLFKLNSSFLSYRPMIRARAAVQTHLYMYSLGVVIIIWYHIRENWLGCVCDVAPLPEPKKDESRCYYTGRDTKLLWKLVDRQKEDTRTEEQ